MTLERAIALLSQVLAKHGNTEVYFDCPECGKSFCPTTVATQAVHIGGEKPKQ